MKAIAHSLVLVVVFPVISALVAGCAQTPDNPPPANGYYDVDLDGTNNQGRLVE